MTLRILHVLDHSIPLQSGYTFRTLAILKEQRRLGWETIQLTSSKHYGATADEETIDGFKFFRTRSPQSGWRTFPVLDQAAVIADLRRRIQQVLRDTRPDLIHAHSPCLNGIAALAAARPSGVPVVYEMRASWEDAAVDHGTTTPGSARYRLSRAMESWTLRRADAVTTICEGLRADILLRGLDTARVTVIPNAVDPDAFQVVDTPSRELQARLGLEGAFTIGFIGSFYGYEGLDVLVQAIPAILSFESRARLLLVGGGPEEARLQRQVTALGLSDKVHFAGRVPHDRVTEYYSVVDLLAYPRKSIRLTETVTPLKPLEAMAQGRLLVASDVGGHRELIEHGRTGLLFRPDDATALAEAVRAMLDQRNRWPEIRQAGREFVMRSRNWRASVGRYPAVYEAAIEAAGRA
jgi:PEP-CTERM/exosortase A-associated glycosyltransferase